MSGNKRPRLEHDDDLLAKDANSPHLSKPRLIRACAECKRHKVKCDVKPGQTSCNKCLRSGVACVPHNFAQKFIDDDTLWKSEATTKLDQVKAAVQYLLQHNNLPDLSRFDGTLPFIQTPVPTNSQSNDVGQANLFSEGPSAVQEEDDSDLVPVPMNNLYNLTEPRNSRLFRVDPADANGPDFISRGVLPVAEAEFLFAYYRDYINVLLWDGVLCPHRSLQEARQSSSLLVATVLTVAALHSPDQEKALHATYDAFVSLMRGSCLLRSQNLDDIRGLCIGAFFLTSLSWALCSRAVRVATEMNLHKPSLQFSRASPDSYERVRLWYVLYVCDHQFALAYGRPPMMHEDAAVRNVEKFQSSGLCTNGDIRLAAQVSLFRILADAYFMYGCDPDLELGEKDFERLRQFNVSVDQWRLSYQSKAASMTLSGSYPSKEIVLYYHLARFQLNSMSLRGISARSISHHTSYTDLSWDHREAADIAIAAATSTLKLIMEEPDLCRTLVSMPIFTHAMIAVCASFLLKMAVAFGNSGSRSTPSDNREILVPRDLSKLGLNFRTEDALTVVQDLVRVLKSVADKASLRHVARHIVTGLEELLQRFARSNEIDGVVYSRLNSANNVAVTNGHTVSSSQTLNGNNARERGTQGYSSNQYGPQQELTAGESSMNVQYLESTNIEDPFDFMGDLDWRFNESYLWTIDGDQPYF